MKNNISVVINTYNASKYLARVLETAKSFDEIVVCDMESTDNTVEIAQNYGAKGVTFPKENHSICEVARDFAIHSAKNKWVLVVDADELIPEQLHTYLSNFIEKNNDIKGLYIPRQNLTMNVPLPSSYPDYQLRFFDHTVTTWPPVIHCRPVINGKLDYIPKKNKHLALLHLDDSTRATLIRQNNYTDNEVEKSTDEKVTLLKIMFSPTMRFLKQYILKGGFRYGIAGYVQAVRSAHYKFTVLCKLYEKQIGL